MSFRILSITASSFKPYSVVPSRWYRIPKFSICVMPSSSGNSTSASMLIHCAASQEFTATFVRPTGISSVVSVDRESTCAEKYPPFTRSSAPSLRVSAMIWLHPNGTHSPTRITRRLTVICTSSSSRTDDAPRPDSAARCALDAIGRRKSRHVNGKYGDETYDTSSVSVTVLSMQKPFSLASWNVCASGSYRTLSKAPSGSRITSSTALRSAFFKLVEFTSVSRPISVIWYATTGCLSCVMVRSARTYFASTRSSRWSRPSCVTFM